MQSGIYVTLKEVDSEQYITVFNNTSGGVAALSVFHSNWISRGWRYESQSKTRVDLNVKC